MRVGDLQEFLIPVFTALALEHSFFGDYKLISILVGWVGDK